MFKKKKLVKDLSWLGVDIHSHLLPGIDDGSPNAATSISYIKALRELGISNFICTPHVFPESYPNTAETIMAALESLRNRVAVEKVDVEITSAAEYMVDEAFKVSEGHLCLPNQHILIEMSCISETPNITQIIFDLQIMGYTIILAHPERYSFYHNNYGKYVRLKELGVLFQLNLLSVLGYYGKEEKLAAGYLLKNALYDFAGTDLHHEGQLKILSDAVLSGKLKQKIGDYTFSNSTLLLNQTLVF